MKSNRRNENTYRSGRYSQERKTVRCFWLMPIKWRFTQWAMLFCCSQLGAHVYTKFLSRLPQRVTRRRIRTRILVHSSTLRNIFAVFRLVRNDSFFFPWFCTHNEFFEINIFIYFRICRCSGCRMEIKLMALRKSLILAELMRSVCILE